MEELWIPKESMPRWGYASKFKTLMARIFGIKSVGTDGDTTVTGYLWRGSIYITKVKAASPSADVD